MKRGYRTAAGLAVLWAAMLACPSRSIAQDAASPTFAIGQMLEAREGDAWSPAKLVAREGRRYQIEYDDGTREWVSIDRLRKPGTPGSPVATPAASPTGTSDAAPAEKPAAPKPPKPAKVWANGTAVEVKWGGLWSDATIKNRRGDWYLVTYGSGGRMEWVEPWRIREVGSSTDVPYARPNPSMLGKIDAPPSDKPGPMPDDQPGGGRRDASAANDADANGASVNGVSAADEGAAGVAERPIARVDFAAARAIVPAIAPWTYQPPADAKPSSITEQPITLQGGADNSVHVRLTTLDVAGNTALVVYKSAFDPKLPVAETVNLGTGSQIARAEFPVDSLPLSATADGKRVAGRSDGSSELRVDVWDVQGRQPPKHVVSFVPYQTSDDFHKKVEEVALVDATHLLTSNFGGHVAAWTFDDGSAKAVWSLKLARGGRGNLALSPDRRTLAIEDNGLLLFVDAVAGKLVGSIETSARSLSSISWRADGKRLVALDGPTLFAFDLEAGKQVASLGLPTPLAASEVRHLAGDLVWLAPARRGPAVVFDVAARAVVGQYTLNDAQETVAAGNKLVAALRDLRTKRQWLSAWALPGRTPTKPVPLETVATGPDTRVSIDMQIEADEAQRQAVLDALRKQIEARGWTVAPDGTAKVRLVARTENGRSEQRTYGSGPRFGPFARGSENVTVTEKVSRLSVEVDGKPAWAASASSMAGFMISHKEGQSVQQAIDETRFNTEFFKQVTLPETLFAPIESLPSVPTFTMANGGLRPG